MNYLIIAFVVLSLMGSVMWVMPTKRDRFLAKLRMEAKGLGFQVQLIKLVYPREKGEVEPRKITSVAYRLLRGKITSQEHKQWKSWQVIRCEANASEGLISGWAWAMGERTLNESALASLNAQLSELPKDVSGLESTPIQVSAFWSETQASELSEIKRHLQALIDIKL